MIPEKNLKELEEFTKKYDTAYNELEAQEVLLEQASAAIQKTAAKLDDLRIKEKELITQIAKELKQNDKEK